MLGGFGPTYMFSITLFMVPMAYAALSLGLAGVLVTGAVMTAIMVPELLITTPGTEQIGEIWSMAIVVLLGILIGHRVDLEVRARLDARNREAARLASELRYRNLFELAGEAIVLVDLRGTIVEANAAAGALLKQPARDVVGRSVEGLFGREIAAMIAGRRPLGVGELSGDRGPIWVEPVVTSNSQAGAPRDVQVIIRDVTHLHERQQGLEAFARQLLAAREEEAGRIARDLHDGPVQSLTFLRRKLETLAQLPQGADADALADSAMLVGEVMEDLRRTSRDLRPAILDDLGLLAALRSEEAAFAARTGIKARVVTNGTPRRLGAPAELTLLRIAQEALNNVERHADAPSVTISVSFRPAMVRLAILDDGKARGRLPPPADLLAEGKLGVIGMIERARLLGATCRVRPRRGGGLMVEVLVPTGELGGGGAEDVDGSSVVMPRQGTIG